MNRPTNPEQLALFQITQALDAFNGRPVYLDDLPEVSTLQGLEGDPYALIDYITDLVAPFPIEAMQ